MPSFREWVAGLAHGRTRAALPPTSLEARSVPVPPALVETAATGMRFVRAWTCACGARIQIRSRGDRSEGSPNFYPQPPGHRYAGHSVLPSELLTWAGMLEERGWESNPVRCPACRRGMTVSEYKRARRELEQLRAMRTTLLAAKETVMSKQIGVTIAELSRRVEGPPK